MRLRLSTYHWTVDFWYYLEQQTGRAAGHHWDATGEDGFAASLSSFFAHRRYAAERRHPWVAS